MFFTKYRIIGGILVDLAPSADQCSSSQSSAREGAKVERLEFQWQFGSALSLAPNGAVIAFFHARTGRVQTSRRQHRKRGGPFALTCQRFVLKSIRIFMGGI